MMNTLSESEMPQAAAQATLTSASEHDLTAAPAQTASAQPAEAPAAPSDPLRKRGFTGTQLKILAIVVMAIDHIGAIAMMPLLMAMPQNPSVAMFTTVLRCIGRLAFPIFCFLLVEGFTHTHDVKKYALRLAAFAVLSEIPFDLAINSSVLELGYQNVFFTLICGLLAIWAIDALRGKLVLQILAAAACVAAAQLLRTDYAGMGVVTILLFYVLRNHKTAMFWAVGLWLWLGMIVFYLPQTLPYMQGYPPVYILISVLSSGLMEALGAFSFLFLARYNGERGAKLPKYLFYAFYPAHLLVLYGIAQLITALLA